MSDKKNDAWALYRTDRHAPSPAPAVLDGRISQVMTELAAMGWTATPGWTTAHTRINESVYGIEAIATKQDPEGPVTSIEWMDSGHVGCLFSDDGSITARAAAASVITAMHESIAKGILGAIDDPALKGIYTALLPPFDPATTIAGVSLTAPPSLSSATTALSITKDRVLAYESGQLDATRQNVREALVADYMTLAGVYTSYLPESRALLVLGEGGPPPIALPADTQGLEPREMSRQILAQAQLLPATEPAPAVPRATPSQDALRKMDESFGKPLPSQGPSM